VPRYADDGARPFPQRWIRLRFYAIVGRRRSPVQDFRLAVRTLRATTIVTGMAMLSLALGIGANTAIFSLANTLMLRPLPPQERRFFRSVESRKSAVTYRAGGA
jgi:hypothetical protein